MSKASATGQITITSNGTTLHTILQCTMGDLYQQYDGDGWNASNVVISPNFEASGVTKPRLVMQAFSAEQGAGASFDLSNASTTWEVGGVTLSFNDSGVSTTSFNGVTGHFTRSVTNGSPTLTVNKNLLSVNQGNSFSVLCSAKASIGNSSVTLSASFPVSITKGVVDSKRVTIMATDSNNLFTITQKGGTCTVQAMVQDGNSFTTSGYTFKWSILGSNNQWVEKQNSASNRFTVKEEDVDSSAMVRVEAYANGSLYATDVQTINDVSDEYILYPNPTDGNNKSVRENFVANSGDKIVYKPFLRKRGSTSDETGVTFSMNLFTQAGVDISSKITKTGNTFTILESNIRDYGGAQYIITATK